LVRSIWTSTKVPGLDAPNDTAHLKVYYPAVYGGTLEERMTGIMPADSEGGPYPVVLFLSGVNIGQDSYRWLMIELAKAGYIALTFDMIAEQTAGYYGTTPGLDLGVLKPGEYGTRPASIAIEPILATLGEQNANGPLAGMLDLDRIVIAGHSGGGTVAMESARAAFFPACKATFSYSAHCVPADVLGFPKGTVLDDHGRHGRRSDARQCGSLQRGRRDARRPRCPHLRRRRGRWPRRRLVRDVGRR
jgi:predicted dienelactone hydrolase